MGCKGAPKAPKKCQKGALGVTFGVQNGSPGALGGPWGSKMCPLGIQNGVLGAPRAPLGDPWVAIGSPWWKKGWALPNLGPHFGSILEQNVIIFVTCLRSCVWCGFRHGFGTFFHWKKQNAACVKNVDLAFHMVKPT